MQPLSLVALVVVAVSCVSVVVADCKGEPRGWGDSISWSSFDGGLQQAQRENKPVMLIIHKTWCGTCGRGVCHTAPHSPSSRRRGVCNVS